MGDVTVAKGAVVAPGVVLQASPESRIAIAQGACLAGGVCIQSRQGVLTIETGVSLGANVLVIGHGKIGANACISPGSTLINPQIEANALLPPNTLANTLSGEALSGKMSAKTPNHFSDNFSNGASSNFTSNNFASNFAAPSGHQESDSFVNTFVEPPPIGPKAIEIPDLNDQNGKFVDPSVQNNGVQLSNGYNNNGSASSASPSNTPSNNGSALSVPANDRVYGKDQVSRLISTLFPNRP